VLQRTSIGPSANLGLLITLSAAAQKLASAASDPNYALAYTGLGDSNNVSTSIGQAAIERSHGHRVFLLQILSEQSAYG
jgi:hypothetical protein